MPDGKPYPSGTAYEVLSAIDAAKRGLPDVYVFRFPHPPSIRLDDPARDEMETQWEHLKAFFEGWFKTPEGDFKAAFQTFTSTDDFEAQAEVLLRKWLEEKVLHGRSLAWPVDVKGSPFRGLAAFGAKHAPVFFGRSRDSPKPPTGSRTRPRRAVRSCSSTARAGRASRRWRAPAWCPG